MTCSTSAAGSRLREINYQRRATATCTMATFTHRQSRSSIFGMSITQSELKIPLNEVSTKSHARDGDVVFVDASEDDEGTSRHVVVINPTGIPCISGLHTIVAKGRSDAFDHGYRALLLSDPRGAGSVSVLCCRHESVGVSASPTSQDHAADAPDPEQQAIAAS